MRRYHYSEVTPATARRIRLRRAGSWYALDAWLSDQADRRRARGRKKINRWKQRHQGELRRIAVDAPKLYEAITLGWERGIVPVRSDPLWYGLTVRLAKRAAEHIMSLLGPGELSDLGRSLVQGVADGLVADPTWVQTPDGPRLVEVSLVARKDTPS